MARSRRLNATRATAEATRLRPGSSATARRPTRHVDDEEYGDADQLAVADDPGPIGHVLHLGQDVRREEHCRATSGRFAHEPDVHGDLVGHAPPGSETPKISHAIMLALSTSLRSPGSPSEAITRRFRSESTTPIQHLSGDHFASIKWSSRGLLMRARCLATSRSRSLLPTRIIASLPSLFKKMVRPLSVGVHGIHFDLVESWREISSPVLALTTTRWVLTSSEARKDHPGSQVPRAQSRRALFR